MKFVLFIVATLSHIIDIRLIHCIVLCDIHMTFQLTINQTESVGFGNRLNNVKIVLEHTENLLTHPYKISYFDIRILFYCAFFIGHIVKNDIYIVAVTKVGRYKTSYNTITFKCICLLPTTT